MREYLLSVAGIVLFSSVLLGIVPGGKTAELIKSIARLACLMTILSPIVQFFVAGKNVEAIFGESGIQTQSEFIQYCRKERIAEIEKELKSELSRSFDYIIDVQVDWSLEVKTQVGYETQEVFIQLIRVVVDEKINAETKRKIEDYIWLTYGCQGRVEIFENIDDE